MSRFSARTGCSASGACVDLLAEIAVGAEVSDERCSPFRPQFFVGGMEQAFGVRAVLSRSQQIPQQSSDRGDHDTGEPRHTPGDRGSQRHDTRSGGTTRGAARRATCVSRPGRGAGTCRRPWQSEISRGCWLFRLAQLGEESRHERPHDGPHVLPIGSRRRGRSARGAGVRGRLRSQRSASRRDVRGRCQPGLGNYGQVVGWTDMPGRGRRAAPLRLERLQQRA